ncbi:hypothetical protein [Phycicoccus sp.]|uniref:hypothetical protein n=1 Tax=Phycicoccus sp. TaxID=1902410 RepID=UPI002C4F2D3A|nr:hypothetical protein [Phycicoccus sp.]HMM93972.1 hypothetical protein [Phycicoccus sp.]
MPPSLLVYRAEDWSGPMVGFACTHPECRFWEAYERWADEHPADPDPSAPSTPYDLPLIADGPDLPFHPGEAGQPAI